MLKIFKKKINNNKKINAIYYENKQLFIKLSSKVNSKILEKFKNATSEEEAENLRNLFVSSDFCEHGKSEQLRYINYYDNTQYDYEKGQLGDATKEIIKEVGSGSAGWYSDYSYMAVAPNPWFYRGGGTYDDLYTGTFSFYHNAGYAWTIGGSRVVIVAE